MLRTNRIPVTSTYNFLRICYRSVQIDTNRHDPTFEPVYRLESIKYASLFNRFKIYLSAGAGITVPICALLESVNVLPSHSSSAAAYIGITGTILFSLGSLLTKNIIGILYIDKDNEKMKISAVDYWGKRRDYIISLNEWIPIEELPSNYMKLIYFSPQLPDGTKLKLFFSQGKIVNKEKLPLL